MRTIKLTIEYDGTKYCGWQIQQNGVSIQGDITRALRKMTGEENHVIGASRTDAGVHALGQVAHFRTLTMIPPAGFMRGINSALNRDVAVVAAEEASPDFHAQKDAVSKLYRYLILNADAPSALMADRCWHIREQLDVSSMREASEFLIGRHDFRSFQAAGSSAKDAVREIDSIVIARSASDNTIPGVSGKLHPRARNDGVVSISVTGNGFVYHMVRNIVGTLVLMGNGRLKPSEMAKILKAKERKRAGATAPAHGLYLVKVDF
jgi:tRNA pseudouridine38-40 synthase